MGFIEDTKIFDDITNNTYSCKCGHKVFIPKYSRKVICNWCSSSVFRSKKDEFMYMLGKKNKRDNKVV